MALSGYNVKSRKQLVNSLQLGPLSMIEVKASIVTCLGDTIEFSLMIGAYYQKQTLPPVYNKLCNKGMVHALIWGQICILIIMFAVNR